MSHDGRLIVQREVTSNGSALDIELPRSLANGTYMLHLVSGAVRHTLRVQVLR